MPPKGCVGWGEQARNRQVQPNQQHGEGLRVRTVSLANPGEGRWREVQNPRYVAKREPGGLPNSVELHGYRLKQDPG